MTRLLPILLSITATCLHAANPLPENETEMTDIWASVFYCQAIYEEPRISERIYEGDRDSCNEAHRMLGLHALENFSEEDTQSIFQHAQHKAAVIRYNTRSVQQAVAACRELCRAYND